MAAFSLFALVFVVICQLSTSDAELKAKPGEDVTLPCNTTDANITLVRWKISGLEDDVFYFRDNKPIGSFQNPQFRGRVELKDQEMTNGDCSVVLKNVSANDTGTYTCQRNGKFVSSVHLSVSEDSENEAKAGNRKNGPTNDGNRWGRRGYVGLGVGWHWFFSLLLVFFSLLEYNLKELR